MQLSDFGFEIDPHADCLCVYSKDGRYVIYIGEDEGFVNVSILNEDLVVIGSAEALAD